MRTSVFLSFSLLAVVGCTTTSGEPLPLTKAEARMMQSADGPDFCAALDWYGDGICDDWCPLPDRDCGLPDCGGIAGIACPAGEVCVDDPSDDCDPAMGGADCGGLCVDDFPAPDVCGGIAGLSCPSGTVCVDDPADDCDPTMGGADCIGMCVDEPSPTDVCGGIAGLTCSAGKVCVDDPTDTCDPESGGADCIGVCTDDSSASCGGFAGIECPMDQSCVDDPRDGCDPASGGADCPGLCVGDCRSLGCGAGEYCGFCWIDYQCLPEGAVC